MIERRKSEALEAAQASGPDAASHQLALDAAEYVAAHRALEPLKADHPLYNPTQWRVNTRVALEAGIREHHSFKKAFARLPGYDVRAHDPARRFFAQEEKTFRAEFTRQARSTALDMLDASEEQMKRVLREYGLPVEASRAAAARIWGGADVEPEARALVKQALQSGDVDNEALHQRTDLAQTVGRLKRQQALVGRLDHEAGRAALDVPINATGPKADAMMKKKAEAEAEVLGLRRMWIEAERIHPILAAYRHGGTVDKVDLGRLDTDPVEGEMHGVLVRLLPKLADLLEARHKIYVEDKHLSPLSIPSVVAMTKANMFIPRGSIREGIANDLAEEAGSEPRWIIFGAIVLALVTLIPSGGASLAIATGLASAGMAAYSAVHDWETYSNHKVLSDTDLDIARSLSSEEPSLTPFVVSLVALGLEPLALLSAFNKARRLRALAASGKDTSALVHDLNKIGKPRRPNLGEEALEDVTRGVRGAAPTIENLVLGFGNKAEVRAAVLRRFTAITGQMPERWDMVRAALRETDGDVNRELLRLADRHMAALRDPEAWADVIADAWEIAAGMRKPSLRKALLQLAVKRGITKMVKVRGVLEGGKFFDEVVIGAKGIVDPKLAVGVDNALHGELTHLIQDLVVDSRLGPDASAAFRGALKHAEGTIQRFVRPGVPTRFGAFVNTPNANVTFLDGETSMKTGDYVWRFTNDLLYVDPRLRRLPQPEAVGPVLDELFELK